MSEIIRKQQVTVATVTTNRFGGLEFTDGAGTLYKISDKRVQYFKDTIIPGASVQLNYAMSSFGKEFIFSADKMGQASVASPITPPVVTPKPTPLAVAPTGTKGNPELPPSVGKEPVRTSRDQSIDEAVAIKAVVELAGGKVIEPNHPLVTAVKSWCSDKLRNYLSTIPPEAIKSPVIVSGDSQSGKGRDADIDRRMLFSIIKTKLKFNTDNAALQWLLQVNKIPQERIDNEPDIVFTEMSVKYDWD